MGPGAKAEDIKLWKAMLDKWEGLTSMRIAATAPHPPRGEVEGKVEGTDQSKINAQR